MGLLYWLGAEVVTGCLYFFFQAEDGIRDLVRSRGLGDVYKRQMVAFSPLVSAFFLSSVVFSRKSTATRATPAGL